MQRIANTIIANLDNTMPPGLFNGKLGLALFLYQYAKRSGMSSYEDIASHLLDGSFSALSPNMSPSAIDGVASIGCGLLRMTEMDLIEMDEHVLKDIDALLLDNPLIMLHSERHFPVPLFSSGIYCIERLKHDDEVKDKYANNVIKAMESFVLQENESNLKLSLLNSLLFVCKEMQRLMLMGEQDSDKLISNLQKQIEVALNHGEYNDIDIYILSMLWPSYLTESNRRKQYLYSEKTSFTIWRDLCWWSILYRVKFLPSGKNLTLIEEYARFVFYEQSTANSQLAGMGLFIDNSLFNI